MLSAERPSASTTPRAATSTRSRDSFPYLPRSLARRPGASSGATALTVPFRRVGRPPRRICPGHSGLRSTVRVRRKWVPSTYAPVRVDTLHDIVDILDIRRKHTAGGQPLQVVYMNKMVNVLYAWKALLVELLGVPLKLTEGLVTYEKGRA
ncbi:hypothetical protein GCM10010273_64760 [Streptomyces lavendulocolor]